MDIILLSLKDLKLSLVQIFEDGVKIRKMAGGSNSSLALISPALGGHNEGRAKKGQAKGDRAS